MLRERETHGATTIAEPPAEVTLVVGVAGPRHDLSALEQFFRNTPRDTGMAFVVFLGEAMLDEPDQAALRRVTSLPVQLLSEPARLEPNRVYLARSIRAVSPEGRAARGSRAGAAPRSAIDRFFRALATTYGRRTAAILLAAGGKGLAGLSYVRACGGLALAETQQPPGSTGSAVGIAGAVDALLPAAEMPGWLAAHGRTTEDADMVLGAPEYGPLAEVLSEVRDRTGHDFSHYRRAVLQRRIGRRLQARGLPDLPSYLALLHEQPAEVDALLQELLNRGASLVRDVETLALLEEKAVPSLLADKRSGDPFRVWIVGCGTGEVAYTLAMLLLEHVRKLKARPNIEIFATDVDDEAIAVARHGTYPASSAEEIFPARFDRFLIKTDGQCRIAKGARDLVVFAPHNVLSDPPFIRLDLLVCWSGLATLNRPAQERVIRLFEYSLRAGGYMLLDTSGVTERLLQGFAAVGKNQRLYWRVPSAASVPRLGGPRRALARENAADAARDPSGSSTSLREIHLQQIAERAPVSALIDRLYNIVHLSRSDNRLFRMPEGTPSHNLLRVVPPLLRLELQGALLTAANRGGAASTALVPVEIDGAERLVSAEVQPVVGPEWASEYTLVVFHEHDPEGAQSERVAAAPPLTGEQLEEIIGSYLSSIEAQRIANEELRVANDELRAMAAELEVSHEELRSLNEELTTVERELRRRIEEIRQAHSDLQNLMNATDIATIFLDRELAVTRFTPQARRLIRLIPSDLGRPLAHIVHTLQYDEMLGDATSVAAGGPAVEREIADTAGRWHMARLLPYQTSEGQLTGVVLTFIEITSRKRAEDELRRARDELEQRVAERTRELARANQQLHGEIAERRQALAELQRLEKARTQLLHALVTAQEEERRRIALELHDQLGQSLTALRIGLAALARPEQSARSAVEMVAWLQRIAAKLDEDVDRLALELRPSTLDDLGLRTALQQHVEQWSETAGISAEFHAIGLDDRRIPTEFEIVIYRIVQESLTNVLKHAAARHVSVILERRGGQIVLIVEDDGRGFDPEALEQHPGAERRLGLLGMEERVALVGGTFTVESTPGSGTTLFVRIPIEANQDEGEAHA